MQTTTSQVPAWLPKTFVVAASVIVATLALLWLARQLSGLLSILVVSLFLSFALEPAVNRLAGRGLRRGVATGVMLVVVAAVSAMLVVAMLPLLADEVRGIVDELPGWLNALNGSLETRFGYSITEDAHIRSWLDDAQASLSANANDITFRALGVGSSLASAVFKLVAILLFSYYLMADGPRLRRSICSLFQPKTQRRVLWIWELAINKTGGYLYSRLLLAVLSAAYTYIVLLALGVPYGLPLAVWMGMLSQFVPVVGTYIGMLLPLMVAALEKPSIVLWLLLLLLVYQQVENYLISPKITARTMSIHPAVAFGAAIAGASLAGAMGAFLALPVVAIAQAALSATLPRHQVVHIEQTGGTVLLTDNGRKVTT